VGPLLGFRADARARAGALRAAVADAEAALGAYGHAGRLSVLASTATLVQAFAERGSFEAAEAALAAAGARGAPATIGDAYTGTVLLNARARLRLAQCDAHAALADLLAVGRRQQAMREPNPAAVDWRSQAALAHAALDHPDAALALALEELELARRFGAPRAIGIALRTLGVIRGELAALREAVDVLAASPARLEHARALARSPTSVSRCGSAARSSRPASHCARRSISRPAATPRRSPSAPGRSCRSPVGGRAGRSSAEPTHSRPTSGASPRSRRRDARTGRSRKRCT
jgi:hypothetical protein